MTSPPPPPPGHDADGPVDETDALLSAVLDDVASSDERARVQGDPALRRRLEHLQALRRHLSTPVEPLPPDQVDAMVLAALDAAEDVTSETTRLPAPAGPGIAPEPVPVPLRARRRSNERRPWLVAAAVVAFLALGTLAVPGALDRLSSRDDDASTATADLQDADEANEDEMATAEAPTTSTLTDAGGAAAAPDGPDLGVADSVEELAARADSAPFTSAARDSLGADSTGVDGAESATPPTASAAACPGLVTFDELDRATVASGVVDGETFFVVLLGPTDDGPGTVRVVRAVDCVVVFERAR